MENKMKKAIDDTMEFVQFALDDAPNASQFFMYADDVIYDYILKKYGKRFDDETIDEIHYVCCEMLNELFEDR